MKYWNREGASLQTFIAGQKHDQVSEALHRKCHALAKRKGVILQHKNAKAHFIKQTQEEEEKKVKIGEIIPTRFSICKFSFISISRIFHK